MIRFDPFVFAWVSGIAFVVFYLCWIHFAAIIRFRDARDAGMLNPAAEPLAYVALGVGYALDFLCMLMMSVRLLDAPRFWIKGGYKETLLSRKLTRLTDADPNGATWRGRLALDFRKTYLDGVDSRGVHRG